MACIIIRFYINLKWLEIFHFFLSLFYQKLNCCVCWHKGVFPLFFVNVSPSYPQTPFVNIRLFFSACRLQSLIDKLQSL